MRKLTGRSAHNQNIWGTAQCHFSIFVPRNSNYYIHMYLKPHYGVAGSFLSTTRFRPLDSSIWKRHQECLMTAPLTFARLYTIKRRTRCFDKESSFALFTSDFSPFMRLRSVTYVGWKTIGGYGRLVRCRATLMSRIQKHLRSTQACLRADSILLASCQKYWWCSNQE